MATKTEPEKTESFSDKDVKAPNLLERAKEEIEAILHPEKSPHHHKETHGMNDNINENTPIDEVKAPGVFERAKEEIEALVEAIHPKKGSESHDSSSKKHGGFFVTLGRKFEKICSPGSKNRD
ncbi:hypothetical protein IFM89_038213 [Coptis chinensis]|uniref:Uncharacterized protein n=1 Tax=Coptis chinensis TaxID=261450 RepID=A0A835IL92_9MAGN|nr:hypothetical protein IFM89_038213 [Coptis chinensis]